jgi:hypothetical protein
MAFLVPTGLALLMAAAAAGCARLAASPPEPPAARRNVLPAGAGTPAVSSGATVVAGGSTAASTPSLPPNRDPGEEITPEELATISEPVPGSQSVPGWADPGTPSERAQGSPQAQSTWPESGKRRPASLWRVQIFVTQDRDLADRKAKEAAERLQVKAHVEFESPNYKVRLGDYASEGEAQPLRDRALYTGYPGAFRVRCDAHTSYELD